ncbi:MAG: type 1 glutamine amidotransferase [Culicoidibacterales bacterium]
MELHLAWLYDDLLELYGDRGNVTVLRERCAKRGITLHVHQYSVGDQFDLTKMDMIFIGGGSDREQNIIYEDLLARREDFVTAIENNAVVLLICGGYQMLGQYYKDLDGKMIPGLGIFDYYTESSRDRMVGYIGIDCHIDGHNFQLVGFENHGGKTQNVATPLGSVFAGHGNNGTDGQEGVLYKNVFGTYLHGPLLPRNPELADLFIEKMMRRYEATYVPVALDDSLELGAKQQVIRELKAQI